MELKSVKEISYKCFYKPNGTVWKHFYFEAKNDKEALEIVDEEMERFNVENFGVERITKEVIYKS
jgi:hypothetical protein